jgi:hypothetical protein
MLLYRGVCLEDSPGFYVNPARKSIPKAIALGIFCILMSLELDVYYISFHILFVNCLLLLDLSSCSVSINCISVLIHL